MGKTEAERVAKAVFSKDCHMTLALIIIEDALQKAREEEREKTIRECVGIVDTHYCKDSSCVCEEEIKRGILALSKKDAKENPVDEESHRKFMEECYPPDAKHP